MNQITWQSPYQTTTAQGQIAIGQQAQTPDGRTWVYVRATGVLAVGSIAVPDGATAVDNVSSSTNANGVIVYITKASAGWTVGAFANQWGVIDDGTGVGQTFKILTNTTDTLTLSPETPLTTALSSVDSDLTIYSSTTVVKSAVTSKLQNAVGIAQVAFAALDYGWVLKQGNGTVLAGNTLVVGSDFTTGDDTTGQAIVGIATNGQFDAQSLGRALVANSAADIKALVYVDIV